LNFTAFYTEYGVPKTLLVPGITIRRADTGAVVVGPLANMTEVGDGFYTYDYTTVAGYDPTLPYVAVCDGWDGTPPDPDTLDQRYTYGGNILDTGSLGAGVWDEPVAAHAVPGTFGQEVQDTFTVSNEVLDLLENRLTIDTATSTLNLWDDVGTTIIKTWPIRDKTAAPGTVSLGNLPTTVPVDRDTRTL